MISSHPAVAEVAVLGLPDIEWGEVVTAFVALKPDVLVSESELIQHARSQLTSFKLPRSVRFCSSSTALALWQSAPETIVQRSNRFRLVAGRGLWIDPHVREIVANSFWAQHDLMSARVNDADIVEVDKGKNQGGSSSHCAGIDG